MRQFRRPALQSRRPLLLKAYGAGIPYNLIGVGSTLIHNYYHTAESAPFVTSHQTGTQAWFDQKDPTWSGRPA